MPQKPANAISSVLLPSGQITPNATPTTLAATVLPATATYAQLEIDRTTLGAAAGAAVIQCSMEISYDGGNTWILLIGFGTDGGTVKDQNGTTLATSHAFKKVKPERGFPRQIRAKVQTTRALTTSVTLGFW